MRKTKFVALLLVVALLASMVIPGVSAAEEYTVSVVSSSGAATIDANAGDKVTMFVALSGNPGISSLAFRMDIPEGWTITAARDKAPFNGDGSENASTVYTQGPGKDYHIWLMATGTNGDDFEDPPIPGSKLCQLNGNLVQIQYQIPEDAVSGTYEIGLTADDVNCFYYNVDAEGVIIPDGGKTELVPATKSITINVTGTEPEAPAAADCAKHGEVSWTDWAGEAITVSGHYKLTASTQLAATVEIAEGVEACIDLNGCELSAPTSARTFVNAGTLSIMDSSEAKTGTVKGTQVAINGANIRNEATGIFTLYSGTIADGDATGSTTKKSYGGNFYSSGTLNLLGGSVVDGNAYHTGDSSTGRGGNIYTDGGVVVIENCVISGGTSEVGGNAYFTDTEITIKGRAKVQNGVSSETYAGNIYSTGSDLTIQDNAEISGGVAATGGGNLYSTGSAGSLTIKDNVVIKDGKAGTAGGNIYSNSNSTLTINGNVVIENGQAGLNDGVASNWGAGNLYVFTGVVANISGNVQILGGTSSVRANSIVSRSTAVLTISGNVVITAQDGDLPAINNYSSTINVGAGVTTYSNPKAFVKDCDAVLTTKDAEEVTCYKVYTVLKDALEAAQSGDTVILAKDATADNVEVLAGVTLDLNGKNLTADQLAAGFEGAHVVDTVGTAKLTVEKLNSSIDDGNAQIPVYYDGGYTFEKVDIAAKLDANETTGATSYMFYVENLAEATKLDEAIAAGGDVQFEVYVTYKLNGEGKYKIFTLAPELLAAYAADWDNKMIVLNFTDLTGITELTCTARVVSSGVTAEPEA